MLFADDIVLVAERQEDLQEKLEECRRSLEEYGLRVCREKTEYMEFNTEGGGDLMMEGCQLKNVDSFKYLRSIVSKEGSIDEEISCSVQA